MASKHSTGITATTVRFGDGISAVRALPKAKGRRPGVILLHERYGIDQHTKDLTVKLAQAGFVGFAPDLFHRFTGDGGPGFQSQEADFSVGDCASSAVRHGGGPDLRSASPHQRLRRGAQFSFTYRMKKRRVVLQTDGGLLVPPRPQRCSDRRDGLNHS